MPTICEEVAKLTIDIRNMLRAQDRTSLNQTAAVDNFKITDIRTSVIKPTQHGYRRTPKGKAVIYTKITDNLEPDSRDVEEIAEQNRPFMCRAVRMFAKDEVACYAPADNLFRFVKANFKSIDESEKDLKEAVRVKWGDIPIEKWSDAEKQLHKIILSRRRELRNILDTEPMESAPDPYTHEMVTIRETRPGLASKVLKKCAFILK